MNEIKNKDKQPVELNEAAFLRKFIRHMTGTLEEVVGLHDAGGFIATVSQRIGEQINESYKQATRTSRFDRQQVIKVIADLQKRIKGKFQIQFEDNDKIVLAACICPFGQDAIDRPSICMMTSNIIGVIFAENLGYAKVSIEESIAQGDLGCRVVIYLKDSAEAKAARGREYYQS